MPGRPRPPAARAVWAYPVVGALVGGIGGASYGGLVILGVPRTVAAFGALLIMILSTGALHEDGLADAADGLGGGTTRAQKLEIMRDSRIGGFGALALVFSVGIRVAAVASLSAHWGAVALLIGAAGGRAAMVIVLAVLRPARADGMAAGMGRGGLAPSAAAWAIAGGAAFAAVPWRAALAAIVATALAGLLTARVAHRQIGGHTGDVLGASEQVAEAAVLSALAAMLRG